MAAEAINDVLSLSSHVFDHSDALFTESKRFVKHVEPKLAHTTQQYTKIDQVATAGIRADSTNAEVGSSALREISTEVTALLGHTRALTSNVDKLDEVRKEAVAAAEARIKAEREKQMEEFQKQRSAIDEEHEKQVTALYENHGLERPAAS